MSASRWDAATTAASAAMQVERGRFTEGMVDWRIVAINEKGRIPTCGVGVQPV